MGRVYAVCPGIYDDLNLFAIRSRRPMTAGFVATVAWQPLVDVVDAPALVRWNMAYAYARTG
jgi:hypothetical protein